MLGTAVGHHNLAGIDMLVDRALVAIELVVNMLQYSEGRPFIYKFGRLIGWIHASLVFFAV
ncbi:hypothetical protein CSC75_19225 [Pseudoxanthomonas wuyuanensis]|nr:hypothetical protein CSC75_19225 [Pseudoxanthomonas wuyuanensis]